MKKPTKFLVFAFLLLAVFLHATISKPPQAKAADASLTTALKAFNQRKYAEAAKQFAAIEKSNGTDASVQYYLGASALLSGDHTVGRNALCRASVMTSPKNPFHLQANALLERSFRCQPYSCLTDFYAVSKTFRWSKSAMPLKVFISNGLMLPAAYHHPILDPTEANKVVAMVKNGSYARLSVVPDFRGEFRSAVSRGISQWGWAVGEQLISYQFVSDPKTADIVVFWVPTLGDRMGHTTTNRIPRNPIVMQMSMEPLQRYRGNAETAAIVMQETACHEFGHALGLGHSDTRGDMMYPSSGGHRTNPDGSIAEKGGNTITENDRGSLRGLYTGLCGVAIPSVAGK